MVVDESLYRDASALVRDLRNVTNSVQRGPGAVSRLINDPEIYFEARRAIRNMSKTAEDISEATPISTSRDHIRIGLQMRSVPMLLSEDPPTEHKPESILSKSGPIATDKNRGGASSLLAFIPIVLFITVLFQHTPACGSAYDFLQLTASGTLFALDPDITIRRIDPRSPNGAWTLAEGWGLPPLFFRTSVPGLYRSVGSFLSIRMSRRIQIQK